MFVEIKQVSMDVFDFDLHEKKQSLQRQHYSFTRKDDLEADLPAKQQRVMVGGGA
jgi:hypothetical protein